MCVCLRCFACVVDAVLAVVLVVDVVVVGIMGTTAGLLMRRVVLWPCVVLLLLFAV